MLTIANVDMAAAWDGEEGAHWAANADRYETAGRRQWARFAATGLIAEGDDVLDVGCGTGAATRGAARLALSGSVLGVDLSARMLEKARERSAADGILNVTFEQADAQVHPFDEGAFDIAMSSFGAMFFADPGAAFANIARAVRPGGSLALLTWRELPRNDWLMAIRGALAVGRDLPQPPPGAPGPFGLADADWARAVLTGTGFDDVSFEPIDEPVEFGGDADEAFAFLSTNGMVRGLTQDLDDAAKSQALDNLRAVLAAHETDEGVLLAASAWLITARRR